MIPHVAFDPPWYIRVIARVLDKVVSWNDKPMPSTPVEPASSETAKAETSKAA
jgi:hypothetical protein